MRVPLTLLVLAAFMAACTSPNSKSMNKETAILSVAEINEGWLLLFDGQTTDGWHSYGKKTVGSAWKVMDSSLFLDAASKQSGSEGGGYRVH